MLDTAVEIGATPEAGLVEKVVAWQAAHRVRADLQDRAQLPSVQCQLVDGLEGLGDPATAFQVAHTALADLDLDGHPGSQNRQERDKLSAAVLRLVRAVKARANDPLIDATVALRLQAVRRSGWKRVSGPPLTCWASRTSATEH